MDYVGVLEHLTEYWSTTVGCPIVTTTASHTNFAMLIMRNWLGHNR
jgi:hypothetical protein